MEGRLHELREAEKLVREVESWSRAEIEELAKLYREKAEEYQEMISDESGSGRGEE